MFAMIFVIAASLVISTPNVSRQYGEKNPVWSYQATGLQPGHSVQVQVSCDATARSPVGTYPIKIVAAAVTGYDVSTRPGTLTITPRTLTVTVLNATESRGYHTLHFSSTSKGLLPGDAVDIYYYTTATPTSPPGTYPIKARIAGRTAANYNLVVVAGILIIR